MQIAKDLMKQSDRLFSKKTTVDSLWQELALHFYPERASFTQDIPLGDDFAAHILESTPVLMRRDLCDQIAGIARPKGKEWFRAKVDGVESVDAKQELADWSDLMRSSLYSTTSRFVRATKQADADYATFGNAVLSIDFLPDRSGLYWRCHHLKHMAWMENEFGEKVPVHRKCRMTAKQLRARFGEDVPDEVKRCFESGKDPYQEFDVRHIVMMADDYDEADVKKMNGRGDYVSLYLMKDKVLRSERWRSKRYVVASWQNMDETQYSFSPATMIGLPDARLIQNQARVLLDAGEKSVNPPLIGTDDAITSPVRLHSGGITWVDREYDEKLGAPLRPMDLGKNLPLGLDMKQDTRSLIAQAFYLNKLNLPTTGDMTAYETQQRVQEYIRAALPLFEPVETEYTVPMLDEQLSMMLEAQAFGPVDAFPDELQGRDVSFTFENPLTDMMAQQQVARFTNVVGILGQAIQADPNVAADVDVRKAAREAIEGMGAVRWLRSQEQADQDVEAAKEQQAGMADMQQVKLAAEAASQGGDAAQKLSEAGVL